MGSVTVRYNNSDMCADTVLYLRSQLVLSLLSLKPVSQEQKYEPSVLLQT